MGNAELRQRRDEGKLPGSATETIPQISTSTAIADHRKPSAAREYGASLQVVRAMILCWWMNTVCVATHCTQLLGSPLYLISKDYYYAWMSLTKQSFGVLIITITQWFAPIKVRISAEKACRAQLKIDKDGQLETAFPERLVLIANHQLYSDWIFLWWIAYTSRMHGHIYIILKESLKYVPVIGPGMMFYGFIFMARNWARDKFRLQYRLRKLASRHGGPLSGTQALDPMWLLIFPEGTNLSANTRMRSGQYAAKIGKEDVKHQLLPRSTGLQYCLQELKETVEWVYDCTVAYEGIPPGEYGQDVYTNRGIYFGGRPPKSVNMYWRRFHVSTIPVTSQEHFDDWLLDRWREKDALLEHYYQTGRFPSDTDTPASSMASSMIKGEDEKRDGLTSPWARGLMSDRLGVPGDKTDGRWADGSDAEFLETAVNYRTVGDVIKMFVPLASIALAASILARLWNLTVYGTMVGAG